MQKKESSPLSYKAFFQIKKLVQQHSGLVVKDYQQTKVENILKKIIYPEKITNEINLINHLKNENSPKLQKLIEAFTTNYSQFFRDINHFTFLETDLLPKMFKKRPYLNIWSAASSQGEEAHSLAIILENFCQKKPNLNYQIDASDINEQKINEARDGIYCQHSIKQIPKPYQKISANYLLQRQNNGVFEYTFDTKIKDKINFFTFNLLNKHYPQKKYDIIFCKNALIYFDYQTQQFVLEKISEKLSADGVLFLGNSEHHHDLPYLKPIAHKIFINSPSAL